MIENDTNCIWFSLVYTSRHFLQMECKTEWNVLEGAFIVEIVSQHIIQPFILHLDFWKSRSVSNLRKISGPAHLSFFFSLSHEFFSDLYHKPEKIQVTNWKKTQVYWQKILLCKTWNFSKVWNRPYFLKTLIFRNQGTD